MPHLTTVDLQWLLDMKNDTDMELDLFLHKRATKALIGLKPINKWIIPAYFAYGHSKVTVTKAYALMDRADVTAKDIQLPATSYPWWYSKLQPKIPDW